MLLPSHEVVDFTCMAWNSLFKCSEIQFSSENQFSDEKMNQIIYPCKSICLETLIFV